MHVKLLTFISLKKATTIWVSLLFSFLFWNFRREFLPRSKIWIKMVSLPSIKQKKKLLIVIFLLILTIFGWSLYFLFHLTWVQKYPIPLRISYIFSYWGLVQPFWKIYLNSCQLLVITKTFKNLFLSFDMEL